MSACCGWPQPSFQADGEPEDIHTMPRKNPTKATNAGKVTKPVEFEEDDYEVEEANEETSMLEMISLLQNFQKRKTTNNSGKQSSFTLKKNAIYEEARKNASNAVREGVAYIEQYKSVIENLKAQEVSQDKRLEELSLFAEQEDSVYAILNQFPTIFDELSPKRAEIINDTSAMLETHSAERQKSRRRLIKSAKMRIEEDYENQRVVTDASALIKHYKALLLS